MTTTHGRHVTDLTRRFSMCQEFPEEHIQCLLPGSCEGVHSPGDVIVKSGSSPDGGYSTLGGTARVVYSVATPPAPRWAVIDLVGAGRLFSLVPSWTASPISPSLRR